LTKKDPKLSLSELLSRIARIQIYSYDLLCEPVLSMHTLETINNMWFMGKRESVNAWKKADFDGFREKDEPEKEEFFFI
jgi:hypothetical protein